ncbi:alpha/beta fold hydrolase [Ornithinimicrobium sp. LYQ121]|uniref:alpha/beta fold hydrolase n=1 Tax=Ornithinimicrobium sp. LYQ121 TaxID=3378801 RepID=UPI003854EF51
MSSCGAPTLVAPNGLTYRVQGDPDGAPVVVLHGTPGSRFSGTPAADALHRLGLRVVTFDRPGYGDAPVEEIRRVAELAEDVLDVVEDAGLHGPLGVLGGSGGSAVALAFAVRHPERVAAVTLVHPVAPVEESGGSPAMGRDAWLVGMDEQQQGLHRLAREDPRYLQQQLVALLGPGSGAAGIVTDMAQVQEPWGLDPEDVRCPVDLWWGADSFASPAGHARWLLDRLTAAGSPVHQHPQQGPVWPGQRLTEMFQVLGSRIGAVPRTAEELAAGAGSGGCGGGACACGA